jgi:hypothetical protein
LPSYRLFISGAGVFAENGKIDKLKLERNKMIKDVEITIKNKLVKEKRDINVYHHAGGSAHIISYNSSVTLPLRTVSQEDYLHISVISGPGNLKYDCVIDLPSWADFELTSEGKVTVTHSGDRTLAKIPPGPASWMLKMSRPNPSSSPSAESALAAAVTVMNKGPFSPLGNRQ